MKTGTTPLLRSEAVQISSEAAASTEVTGSTETPLLPVESDNLPTAIPAKGDINFHQLLSEEEVDLSVLPAPGAGPQAQTPGSETGESSSSHYQPAAMTSYDNTLLIEETALLSTSISDLLNADTNRGDTPSSVGLNEARSEQLQTGNGAAQLIGTEHYALTEDFRISVQGNQNQQLDLPIQAFDTDNGHVEVNAEGHWHYTLNNSSPEVQFLASGESLVDQFSLPTRNGDYLAINVTIHGSNDAPIISGDRGMEIQEDHGNQFQTQAVNVSGQLNIVDADRGQEYFLPQDSILTPYGAASIDSNGAWMYTLNAQSDFVQGLKDGQHITDIFYAYSQDGTRQAIRIDIEGTNDKPVLSGQNDGIIYLGLNHQAEGTISIIDRDFGESGFQAQNEIAGKYGHASIIGPGHWQYTVDSDLLPTLPEGKTLYDVVSVYTLDGTRQDLIIKIASAPVDMINMSGAALPELGTLLHDSAAVTGLDMLLGDSGSTFLNDNTAISTGEVLSIELADTTLLNLNQQASNIEIT